MEKTAETVEMREGILQLAQVSAALVTAQNRDALWAAVYGGYPLNW